jgi:hypothetical protein
MHASIQSFPAIFNSGSEDVLEPIAGNLLVSWTAAWLRHDEAQ